MLTWIKKQLIKKTLIFMFIMFIGILSIPPQMAQSAPIKVKVGLDILEVREFDIKRALHTLDFYLVMHPSDPTYKDHIEFMNGTSDTKDKLQNEPLTRTYRVKAELTEPVDFRWYPFLEHSLTILLEDQQLDKSKLVFVPNNRDIHLDTRVRIPGWQISGFRTSESDHYYSIFKQTFSQYRFYLNLKKSVLSAILDNLMPSILIVISGLMSILISPRYLNERIAINVAALLSVILLQQSTKAELPPLGYLTYLDKFSVVNYAVLVAVLAESIWVFKISNLQGRTEAKRIDINLGISIVILWIVLHGAALFSMRGMTQGNFA